MGAASVTGLHYNLKGVGKVFVPGLPQIELRPHTLIILPANMPFRIETSASPGKPMLPPDPNRSSTESSGPIRRFVAGDSEPEVVMIWGFLWSNSTKPTGLMELSNSLSQS
jgi:AraC family transcriptional activator of mtrCDE